MREPRNISLLSTPLFIVSLSLLALNDFILKAMFHNWLTGKLSDFAGLVAFTMFACAIWPSLRWHLATIISVSFVVWKSPCSQPVIDLINRVLPIHVGRTPDYSDCVALPAVWLVCLFIPRLRSWPVRRSLQTMMAVLSLFLFTATSSFPTHQAAKVAFIPAAGDRTIVEKQLQGLFDAIASQHGLRCTVCDSLSSGRLYAKSGIDPYHFSLVANYDAHERTLFFSVRSAGSEASRMAGEVDLLKTEIENQLRSLFPDLKVQEAREPERKRVQLGVSISSSRNSYETKENMQDYEKAVHVIESIVSPMGLKRAAPLSRCSTVFYTGRLFGPLVYDRELAVTVSFGDWPLIPMNVTSSPEYSEMQQKIVEELELKLQEAFGMERTSTHPYKPLKRKKRKCETSER